MIKNITYENKEAIQNNPDLPKKNMVTDADMNEIKNVVNNNADELNTTKENVENLQEGQGTANTDITNLKSRVSTLETDNTKNKSDIENLQNDNETNQSNIEELQQKTGQIEENILSIEKGQTNQNTEIKNLQQEINELEQDVKANAITEETEQAKSLKITEASGARGSLKVLGNDEQDGEPSLNSSVPIKCLGSNINLYPGWEKNTISSETGKPEINPNHIRSVDFISVLPNKNYTIKAYNIKEFGDLNTSVRMYDINKNYLSSKWIGNIINKSITFTLTNADVRYIKIVCSNNNTVTNTAKVDIKLEEGEGATTYSPFEQGSTEIKHFNTNFLNTENTNKIISGVKIESNTDKSLKITGTATADGYGSIYNKITLPFVLKQGTKVYLNFGKDKQLLKDTNVTPFAWFYSEDSTNTGNINKSVSYVATVSKDTTMLTFGIENIVNAKVYDENMYIVLSTENVEEYVENKNDSYILNIQQEMLTGDYFDLDRKKEIHNWGKIVLTGGETIIKYSDFHYFLTKSDTYKANSSRSDSIASTHFKADTANNFWNSAYDKDNYIVLTPYHQIGFVIKSYATIDEFKSALAEKYTNGKPVIVYYKLETPIELDLTDTQIEQLEKLNKLRFYKGVNNIMTLEDIALLQAKYSVNIQSKINSLINAKISELNQPELLNK